MDILLVTSSFNDEIHGSDDKKKTGCGISLIKPENISKYRIGGVMTDLKEISCNKCKERLAKKIIRSDKKEMARILKEERAKAKKGIEDEGIVPLGNTTAKITKTPEQKQKEEEERAAAERKAAEEKRAAEEAARKAEEEARRAAEEEARKNAEKEASLAAQKNIPGTGIAIGDDLAQFAINVPKEEPEPEPPVQDDFLAQFAIQKPTDEDPREKQDNPIVQDDFLAQFAIPTPEPEYLPADGGSNENLSSAYENDDSVINISEDELKNVYEETSPQPEEEPEINFDGNSDWDFVANQIFGFDGVDIPEPEPQPTEMDELSFPEQSVAEQLAQNRNDNTKPEVPALEDIVPPVLEDIVPPALDDIAPPVLEELSAPAAEKPSVPALDEISVPELPALEDLSGSVSDVPQVPAYDETGDTTYDAAQDNFTDFEIPEVPVLNKISDVAEAAKTTAEEYLEEAVEDDSQEYTEEAVADDVQEYTEETAADDVPEYAEEAAADDVQEYTEETAADDVQEYTEEAVTDDVQEYAEEAAADDVQEYAEKIVENNAHETAYVQIPEAPAAPVQTAAPQPVPVQPVQNAAPVQPIPVQAVPPVQPQIINVPQLTGYDAAGQPIYTYMQMQMTGYDQNGQPIYIPVGGQQLPVPPQPSAVQHRPMMGMSNTMGGQMGANIQKPYVKLDAPTQTPAYIKAKLGNQGSDGQYVQPSANISKIAVNPHAKETSKAFVNAISSSKDYANKNLIETQGLRANTPVLSSIEDVLSQMGDNSLKNKKQAAQAEVNLGSEYKGAASRPSAPARPAVPKKPENDMRNMSKSELKDKKKQDKYAAKFKKDLAKRGF